MEHTNKNPLVLTVNTSDTHLTLDLFKKRLILVLLQMRFVSFMLQGTAVWLCRSK